METRWLHDFLTLSEVRNFTRASELRNLSQAAFSRRIQGLEQWLGTTLVDRNVFPVRLTAAGERFRHVAIALAQQLTDLRAEIGSTPAHDQIRLAAPYAIATNWLAQWWQKWNVEHTYSARLLTGNVHDTVTAFTSGSIDLLICYHQADQPLSLDSTRHDCLVLGTEIIRPYASTQLVTRMSVQLPGSADHPVPLLMYSSSAYFARLIDAAIEHAAYPLYGHRVFEAEMSEVLRDLAVQGLGVAWLAESAVTDSVNSAVLSPLSSRDWDVAVEILAYRQKTNHRSAVSALWQRMQTEPPRV